MLRRYRTTFSFVGEEPKGVSFRYWTAVHPSGSNNVTKSTRARVFQRPQTRHIIPVGNCTSMSVAPINRTTIPIPSPGCLMMSLHS